MGPIDGFEGLQIDGNLGALWLCEQIIRRRIDALQVNVLRML